jgi:anti-sigma regulatory factor (Ser/Thr protein kinase)
MASLDAEFAALPEAPPQAREAVRRGLADVLPAPVLYDVLTVVTELVQNGAEYGDGRYVRLHVSVAGGTIFGEVENSGRGAPRRREIDASEGSGLGLHVVDAIASDVRISLGEESTLVRFAIQPPSSD